MTLGTDPTEVSAGWGKWRLRMSGVDTPHVLIALLITVTMGGMFWWHEQDNRHHERDTALFLSAHAATQKLLVTVATNQGIIIGLLDSRFEAMTKQQLEAARELTYVLSLPQDRREALKLNMPQSLRQKINEGTQ